MEPERFESILILSDLGEEKVREEEPWIPVLDTEAFPTEEEIDNLVAALGDAISDVVIAGPISVTPSHITFTMIDFVEDTETVVTLARENLSPDDEEENDVALLFDETVEALNLLSSYAVDKVIADESLVVHLAQ